MECIEQMEGIEHEGKQTHTWLLMTVGSVDDVMNYNKTVKLLFFLVFFF